MKPINIINKLNEDFWNPGKYFQILQGMEDIDTKKWNGASQEERDAMVRPFLQEFWNKYKDEMSGRAIQQLFDDMEDSNYHTEYKVLKDIINKTYTESTVGSSNGDFDNITTFDELEDKIKEVANEDQEDDWLSIAESYKEKCIDYIEERREVTNTDENDEVYIEESYVKSAIQEINGTLSESLKESGQATLDNSRIADFIKRSVNNLTTTDYTNCKYNLDDTFALFVGWSDGYDENATDDEIYNPESPTWRINAGIKIRNDYDWADYDYLNFPWYDNGEVFDCSLTIDKNEDYEHDARYFIAEYKKIKEEYDAGQLLIESENK